MTAGKYWNCLDDLSLEATTRDLSHLTAIASRFVPGTVIGIPYLANESDADRLHAAATIRRLGFMPMPHLAARRLPSRDAFARLLTGWAKAKVERLLVLAGDCACPEGPFADALALLETGLLPSHGIRDVVIAGYPEGHRQIPNPRLARAMRDKLTAIAAQGLAAEITTQFCFSAEHLLAWLDELRAGGITAPVRLGIPGPANLRILLRYAALCGVGASATVLARYGFSLTRLRSHAAPDQLVSALACGVAPVRHGPVFAHFYPFGGMLRLATWLERQRFMHDALVRVGLP
ncbi:MULTISPECIES: methylenetetrahydrofolate reductase [Acidiphilium]|uniref:methylenetetrahydrofolate reductase n=1 Tax=Acidiphilium TaxID=522 RepID=UPI000461920C|nr:MULTISPECIES: methylenetetrahydrofolate reductase [Acidiphilium]KDM67785.1 methylenetetrahydrofolate reductase [Acidiphilium sp. JA12-A1]MBS3025315.1 methylenetetrahydrofolate reductase [Acidiphilium multivorum]